MARTRNTRVKYNRLVPPDSMMGEYLAYMDTQETAYAYDFWSAAWVLSTVLGRGIVVDRPRAPVYLNVFCIFVAESGITRKSTAVREAVRFARPFCTDQPFLIESKITPEALEDRLHKQAKDHGTGYVAIAVSELVTFLGREKYNEAMPTMLTDLYDCPEVRTGGGSIAKGVRELKNVYVSFLSASTPAWLLRAVNPDVIEGGFTSRLVFVVSEEPKRLNSWPEDVNNDRYEAITEKLSYIKQKAEGIDKITISLGGRKVFDRWYKSRGKYRDPFRSSFQSREDAHVLRLAALLCINDDTWVIQQNHVLSAVKIITECREDGASIFEGTGSSSRIVLGIDKLRDKLLAGGLSGVPQKDLTKAVAPYMNAEHMKAVLDIMHELGMVQQFQGIQLTRGRPTTIWRGLQPLAQSKALDKIIEAQAL